MAKADTAAQRTTGAKDGWEIRRRKQLEREEALIEAAVAPFREMLAQAAVRIEELQRQHGSDVMLRGVQYGEIMAARRLARAFARQLQGMGVTLGIGGDCAWLWEEESGD